MLFRNELDIVAKPVAALLGTNGLPVASGGTEANVDGAHDEDDEDDVDDEDTVAVDGL